MTEQQKPNGSHQEEDLADHEQDILTSYKQIASIFLKLLSSTLALAFLAYPIGWVYTKSYLSSFNAAWMLSNIQPATILQNSAIFILIFIFNILCTVADYCRGSRMIDFINKFSMYTAIVGVICIIISGVLLFYEFPKFSYLMAYVSFYAISAFSTNTIISMFDCIRTGKKWTGNIIFTLFVSFYLSFIACPQNAARGDAAIDLDPNFSTLPIATLRNDKKIYKLIHNNNNLFYLADIYNKKHIEIHVVNYDEISSITKKYD